MTESVTLNPVRAKIAEGLEDSDFTSIQQRLRQVTSSLASPQLDAMEVGAEAPSHACPRLVHMDDGGCSQDDCLPMTFDGYMALPVWTERQARDNLPI